MRAKTVELFGGRGFVLLLSETGEPGHSYNYNIVSTSSTLRLKLGINSIYNVKEAWSLKLPESCSGKGQMG